jgi:hypothetical protein
MKKLFTIALAVAVMAAMSSCTFIKINPKSFDGIKTNNVVGSSNLVSKTLTVPQFTGIDASTAVDIIYTATEGEPTIDVNAPDNIMEMLEFRVDPESGILYVGFQDQKKTSFSKVSVKASSATLESLSLRGAGDFSSPNMLECKSMTVKIFGAGDVDFRGLRCENEFSVDVMGAGDIDVTGLSCQKAKVGVMGAGDVVLEGQAGEASLSIAGAGDIDVSRLACDNIQSSVSGVGSVKRK